MGNSTPVHNFGAALLLYFRVNKLAGKSAGEASPINNKFEQLFHAALFGNGFGIAAIER